MRGRWAWNRRQRGALLVTDCATLVAQMVGYVALPWWITINAGATGLAVYSVTSAVAALVSAPLLAPFCERLPKRSQIIAGLASLLLTSGIVAWLATAQQFTLVAVAIAGVFAVVAASVVVSASANIAAESVPASELPGLLSLQRSAQSIGRIVGPLLGGACLAVGGVRLALLVQPGLLLVAVFAAMRIPVRRPDVARTESRGVVRSWAADLRAGLIAKWTIPLERGWTLMNFVIGVFFMPAATIFIPLKVQALGLPGSWLGLAEASISVGMLAGALLGPRVIVERFGRYNARVAAAVLQGLFFVVVGLSTSAFLMILGLLLSGAANSVQILIGMTHRTLAVPQNFRIRITAANVSTTQLAQMLGPVVASAALVHFTLTDVYAAFGAIVAVSSLAFCRLPRAREFLSLEHAAVVDWYLQEYPHAFAHAATSNATRESAA